jgi:hypothetical protein
VQLRFARLCHDCEEVHADQQCPVCASETFTFITRWVPAPERRKRPRPTTSPEAEIYRQLTRAADEPPLTTGRLLKRAVVGLTAVGLVGWLWGRGRPEESQPSREAEPEMDGD